MKKKKDQAINGLSSLSEIYLSMPEAAVTNNKNLDMFWEQRLRTFPKYVSVKENNPALFPNDFLVKFPKIRPD